MERPGRRSATDGQGRAAGPDPRRSLLAGVLVGIGVAVFLDEVVFHQLLQWHHFYDRSTLRVGIVSDGILHAAGSTALVVGMFLYADCQRRAALVRRRWAAGALLGWGGFQLFDGVVNHKLLRVHQIRYDVELLPYDLAWNAAAVAGLVAGAVLLRRRPGRASAQPDRP